MSLRSNGFAENIRDLIASADAEDETTRGAIGRAVVQALTEIDQANAMTGGFADPATALGTGRGAVDQLSVTLAGLSLNIGGDSFRVFPGNTVPAEVGAALTNISGRVGRAPRRA